MLAKGKRKKIKNVKKKTRKMSNSWRIMNSGKMGAGKKGGDHLTISLGHGTMNYRLQVYAVGTP